MNVMPVLDVVSPRSAAPLDRAVSDSPDPAFANVMSQVRENGAEKTSAGDSGVQHAANCDTNGSRQGGTASAGIEADGQSAEPDAGAASDSTASDTQSSGANLPHEADGDGQTLPPADAVDPAAIFSGKRPKLDQPNDDAADPLVLCLIPPSPPTTVQTAPAAVAPTASASAAVPTGAPAPATSAPKADMAPVVAATQAPADDAPSAAVDADGASDTTATTKSMPNPISLQPAQTAQQSQALAAQTSAAQRAAEQTPGASIVQTLHTFVRPQTNADGDTTGRGSGQRRDLRVRAGDAIAATGNAKSAAHIAALIDSAAAKDTNVAAQDGGDSSIRTDAVTQRANGTPEAPRDTPAARLNDLAQLHAQRFAGELADRVVVLRSQRFDGATVTLEPKELGRIDIQIRLQADTTHVAFTAQHAAVRDALEGQLPRLRTMLEDAGFSLGTVDVAHSGGRGGADAGTGRSYEQQKMTSVASTDAVDTSTPWQRRAESSLIDLHA